jgi:hypothetical protein
MIVEHSKALRVTRRRITDDEIVERLGIRHAFQNGRLVSNHNLLPLGRFLTPNSRWYFRTTPACGAKW